MIKVTDIFGAWKLHPASIKKINIKPKFMRQLTVIVLLVFLLTSKASAQQVTSPSKKKSAPKISSYQELKSVFRSGVMETNMALEDVLVSGKGFNSFVQRKVSTYLTGASEISLSKLYATYTSESDKFTFGFNKATYGENQRLTSLLNPLIETNIKNNFATLYKKDKWQADIRLGFKYSYLLPFSTINFYGTDGPKDQRSKMIRKRSEAAQTIIEKIEKEETAFTAQPSSILTESQTKLLAQYQKQKDALQKLIQNQGKSNTEQEDELKRLDNALAIIGKLSTSKDPIDYDKKLEDYETELAKAEVDALYEKDGYSWSQTSWFSIWGFYPLTERATYIAENNTQKFTEQKFKPWELNAQFNYLYDGKLGTVLFAPAFKIFQNNSALAEIMTLVDYNKYLLFLPTGDTSNQALLETNKAYIGQFKEFTTSNLNIQVVFALPDRKKEGGEKFLTPGLSIRYEKNFGDFSAVNWRFGIPLRFKGKEKDKAVNIEPQLRLNDANNYLDKADFKRKPTFGVNVGVPFTSLFK